MTPYQPRPVRFLGLWQVQGWQLKLYGIASGRSQPRPGLVDAARSIVRQQLASLSTGLPHYSIGFLGVHDGRTSNFVFLDFWANENELYHHVFVSPTDQPEQLDYVTPTGLSACVWDLRLQAFEREAWVAHVLQRTAGPDFSAYLAATLDADI